MKKYKSKNPKYIKDLYVITPFKDTNLTSLKKTVRHLSDNKSKTFLKHFIIYDQKVRGIILDYKNKNDNYNSNNNYQIRFIEIKEKGIYSAINYGLSLIPFNCFYIVIGAGDLFWKINKELKQPKHKIIFLPYRLSGSKNKGFIKHIRSINSGIPYCHNAIVFINDGSRYNNSYLVSADYEYFLKYIKRYKLTLKTMEESIQENIFIEFESLNGISSKLRLKKIKENIIIIYRTIGCFKIFVYICHTLKRTFYLFWRMIMSLI